MFYLNYKDFEKFQENRTLEFSERLYMIMSHDSQKSR